MLYSKLLALSADVVNPDWKSNLCQTVLSEIAKAVFIFLNWERGRNVERGLLKSFGCRTGIWYFPISTDT